VIFSKINHSDNLCILTTYMSVLTSVRNTLILVFGFLKLVRISDYAKNIKKGR